MVTSYVPDAGHIVMMDFDPKVGREQAKRRPALVPTGSALQSGQRPRHCLSAHEQAQALALCAARYRSVLSRLPRR